MSVELKIELTGAVVYVRQAGIGGEKVTALLLGRSKHAHHMPADHRMPAHRATFVFDPDDVADVTGLPAQIIHTAKHKLGLQVDMTGFDLALGEESGNVVVDDGGLPFTRVVNLKDLLPAKATAAANKKLVQKSEVPNDPEFLAGRLFLDSGLLYAVGPVAPEQLDVLWRFTYEEGGQHHVKLETLATDRVAFRCVLPGGALNFVSWSGGREASIKCNAKDTSGRITARLACTPGLSAADAQAGESFNVAANDSHFEMAYDVLEKDPPHRPIPRSSADPVDMRVPGKNCFKAAQIAL